ncbi:osmotically-inducible protein OsmY [Nitrosospira sp. Nsp2]|uniref:BON domain-containing protein n=1 Tax=Nitrosospira sp. Nsp2 TaxID=136548 RepID=UPI000D2FE18C|nr:BON domain-containing protein [Nitrosospira sp. Nsp2]PTR16173.1 osmotically-inducible protein OsmY [Nitrosospira sp. Nsp2]
MRSDSEIKQDVEWELKWDREIDATDIAVAVKDGVVTLSGFVRSYLYKPQAEVDAKRVPGVRAVANDIQVRLPTSSMRPDPEIARDAVAALQREVPGSADRIKVIVKDGWVTLEGTAEWDWERKKAEHAIRQLRGVTRVTTLISLQPKAEPSDIKRKIEDAFRRNAEVDAKNIIVISNGSEITLRGTVRSWAERNEAERVAWLAPGVTRVINEITINP